MKKQSTYETSKLLLCSPDIHPRTQTCAPVADLYTLSGTHQPVHDHCQGAPPVPSLCKCGYNLAVHWDSAASDRAILSRVCSWHPIAPFPRLSLGVVLKMVHLWLEVYNDLELTHGKCCDSPLYSTSLVCNYFYRRFYILFWVLCICNQASLKA